MRIDFTSDNAAAILPEVWDAMAEANAAGHFHAYGDDPITARAVGLFQQAFGECGVYFVWNGTAANTLAVSAAVHSFEAVLCAEEAHLNVSECGAPEKFSGAKLILVPTRNGKILLDHAPTRAALEAAWVNTGFVHASQPALISITQVTECGTVYTPAEIQALADYAHAHNCLLHIDGARIANAAAALGLPFRAFTVDCGVDIVSFGGTKCGLMGAEAVLFFKGRAESAAARFPYVRKQGMQLASKMRYLAAQFVGFWQQDAWRRAATHANTMAALLAAELRTIDGLESHAFTYPVESNAVFIRLPLAVRNALYQHFDFHVWNESDGTVRLMCAYDTPAEHIHALVQALRAAMAAQ